MKMIQEDNLPLRERGHGKTIMVGEVGVTFLSLGQLSFDLRGTVKESLSSIDSSKCKRGRQIPRGDQTWDE
jgi:hypothetical protein